MADVELIKSRGRGYLRSKSEKGRDFILETFQGVGVGSVEMVNIGFNVDNFDDIKQLLEEAKLEIE